MAGMRILVVDDDEGMRGTLAILLELKGHTVVTAGNGREALDRLPEAEPDVILLDYAMPVMDGQAFREAQKADAQWAHIPVVLVTAHHVPDFDAVAILQKPVSYAALAFVLERLRRRDRPTGPVPRIPEMRARQAQSAAYRGECGRCGVVVFTSVERVRDSEMTAIQKHVWDAHPDVIQRPRPLPLGDLIRLVHVRMSWPAVAPELPERKPY